MNKSNVALFGCVNINCREMHSRTVLRKLSRSAKHKYERSESSVEWTYRKPFLQPTYCGIPKKKGDEYNFFRKFPLLLETTEKKSGVELL